MSHSKNTAIAKSPGASIKRRVGNVEPTTDCMSIAEFCRRHSLSVQYFYAHPDQMPDSFRLGARRLITREAAARWRIARDAQAAGRPQKRA